MQPGVTVVLGTVWLVVSVGVLGAATRHPTHLTFDQYSPLPPYNDGVYRGVEGQLDWKDQDPAQDQPLDLSIGPRRSISTNELPRRLFEKYLGKDSITPRSEDKGSLDEEVRSSGKDKQSRNFAGTKFAAGHRSTKIPESFSRETPPAELEDPFVADGTFQDQGPGSVEIYKLDLFKEKALLNPTPATKPPLKNKSKAPKKTNRVNWKPKTIEYKTTSPKVHYRQSNFFDELRTEIPPNGESFGIGGVPELQVGCEGLEASSHKLKRSIDPPVKEKGIGAAVNPWADITPISLDLEYGLSSEEGYEEMDELLKLKRLETTTKRPKQNRGDMEATLHSEDFFSDKVRPEKLPVRGDLGKSSAANATALPLPSAVLGSQKAEQRNSVSGSYKDSLHSPAVKREVPIDDDLPASHRLTVHPGRKLLWLENSEGDRGAEDVKRSKRRIWGFGEDEGVVTSDELQTENERRRQQYERRRQEEARRGVPAVNRTNVEIDQIREEYERMLEEWQRKEEERRRRIQHVGSYRREEEHRREQAENLRRTNQSRSQLEEEERQRRVQDEEMRRRHRWQDEERRRQEAEASRREHEYRSRISPDEEAKKQRLREEEIRRREQNRLEEEERRRQQQEEERARRFQEEERRRRQQVEEARRREEIRRHEEAQRRREEEVYRRRMHYAAGQNLSEEDRRNLEERQREWSIKLRQKEEDERRRQEQSRNEAPANWIDPYRSRPNNTGQYESEAERRMIEQREREREQKLREYMQRNQPINVDRHADRRRMEEERRRNETRQRQEEEEERRRTQEQRRKSEEERKLQEYVRRNQPLHVGRANVSSERNWLENRRIIDEARQYDRTRHPGSGAGRKNHGPSAPANVGPQSYVDEARRRQEAARRLEEERRIHERQRQEQEERRKEALRREEEYRRMLSRRYEEERKRQEAARLEDEKRRKQLIEQEARRNQAWRTRPLENTRPEYQDPRRFPTNRRQDTSLIPSNLVLDGSRRAMERERQRQEQERRRLEAERRRQEERRLQETRRKEQHSRGMNQQQRWHEEARLNALPVSAKIILRGGVAPSTVSPMVSNRFLSEIDFPGFNPNRVGASVAKFPVPPTARPATDGPGPCVWAIVQCCPSNRNSVVTCFESMGCPGVNWDPNPCRSSVEEAAREEIAKFYAAGEQNGHM